MVINVHQREFQAPASELAALLSTLSSKEDLLWPYEEWPRMRLKPELAVGANGGHGPVRYQVEHFDPSGDVAFRFTGPSGFDGWHAFKVRELSPERSLLEHELRMRARGWALMTWPLFFRPLHDALLEEAFDKAARQLGMPPHDPFRRGPWVRLLRGVSMRIGRPPRAMNSDGSP